MAEDMLRRRIGVDWRSRKRRLCAIGLLRDALRLDVEVRDWKSGVRGRS